MKKGLISMMLSITLLAAAVNPAAALAAETDSQVAETAQGQEETAQGESAPASEQEEIPQEQEEIAQEQRQSVQEQEETAEEAEEAEEPVYTAQIEPLEEALVPDDAEETSSEELFAGYIDDLFAAGSASGSVKEKKYAYSVLSGYDLNTYNYLAEQVPKIAAGELTSTIIEITSQIMGLEQTSWTAQDLGVDSIWTLDEEGKIAKDENGKPILNPEAVTKVQTITALSSKKIIKAVLSDFPYELYWYEKTSEGSKFVSFGFNTSYDKDTKTYSLRISTDARFLFEVVDDYAIDQYETDPSTGQTVRTSVENAKKIVDKYGEASDLEKLRGYKNEICDLASYNYAALSSDAVYGNPWQMLWVFDGDPDTKVVCEGYAKAFKYLCDQTDFADDISCILVSGYMESTRSAAGHMWNVVTMDDEKNYLVDVTNCDISDGPSDRVFLVGTQEERTYADGEEKSGYYFSDVNIAYYYDEETKGVFTASDLALCGHNYGEHEYESEYTVDKPATGLETGSKSIHCAVCGAIIKETIQEIPVLPGRWIKNSRGWWYRWSDGTYPAGLFMTIGGRNYYFDASGYMVSGWQKLDGSWYYFSPGGAMQTNWQKIGSYWYYFSSEGVMQKGWQKIGSYWYYFSPGGAMQKGWQKIGGHWFYFASGGAMQTGWQKIGGKWYYFAAGGSMVTGTQVIGEKTYKFSSSGALQ